MSMSPNNPFEDPQNDQGYAYDQNAAPPKSKSGKGCLIGCLIAAVLGLVVCCGGGVLLIQFGVGVLGDELEQKIASNPAIVEHIGNIQSLDVSWSATIEEAQKTGDQESGLIFEITGSEGSAQLLIRDQDSSNLESATLILPDGTRIPIDLGSESSELEELEMDFADLIDPGDVDPGDVEIGEIDPSESQTTETVVTEEPVETEN